jgi:hypothetical protein
MWLRLGVGIGVLGALAAVGCSSGPLPNADVEEFCVSKATQECQVAMSCGVSTSACISVREPLCIADATQAMSTGTRAYAQPNAQACINAVQSAYSQAPSPISFDTLQNVDQTCEQVFPGSVPDGDSCKTEFDCATSGDVCSAQAGSKATICAAPTNVAAEGFCADPGSVCPDGYYCTGSPAKCQMSGTADTGATCGPTVECPDGDYCQINAGATKGTCIKLGATGSACTTDANCSADAPYCDLNVKPKGGSKGEGSCETGLFSTLGTDGDDCKAFGS